MSGHRLHLTAAAEVAEIRTAKWQGRERLIVPVVAMVAESVIHPMNRPAPELVTSQAMASCPGPAWDNCPVVPDHPSNDTGSANTPDHLEAHCFGQLFNTRFEDGRLRTEAWLDVQRAAELGGDPQRVVERCQEGEMVEVSIGCYVYGEEATGTHNGRDYAFVWHQVLPDHLAMLPEGVKGACSIEGGCGGPRYNQENPMKVTTAELDENLRNWLEEALKSAHPEAEYVWVEAVDPEESVVVYSIRMEDEPSRLLQRTFEFDEDSESVTVSDEFTVVRRRVEYDPVTTENRQTMALVAQMLQRITNAQDGLSDADLREALHDALRAAEPGFEQVWEVFPDAAAVIYFTMPEDRRILWRRTFDLQEDESVSLNDDAQEVQPVTEYQPVNAAGCPCNQGDGDEPAAHTKEAPMSTTKLVQQLIGLKGSPFDEDSEDALAKLKAPQLKALIAQCSDEDPVEAEVQETPAEPEEAEQPDESAEAEPTQNAAPKEMTVEEYLAAAPGEVREIVQRSLKQERDHRQGLITRICAAQDAYKKEALAKKDTSDLETLHAALGLDQEAANDYGLRPSALSDGDANAIYTNPPNPWADPEKEAN